MFEGNLSKENRPSTGNASNITCQKGIHEDERRKLFISEPCDFTVNVDTCIHECIILGGGDYRQGT